MSDGGELERDLLWLRDEFDQWQDDGARDLDRLLAILGPHHGTDAYRLSLVNRLGGLMHFELVALSAAALSRLLAKGTACSPTD